MSRRTRKRAIGAGLLAVNGAIAAAIAAFVLLNADGGHTEAQPVEQELPAVLSCANAEFQGEAAFVTTPDVPLEYRCDFAAEYIVPEEYREMPAEYTWTASSGELEPHGQRCLWRGAAPGVQTIRVEGRIVFVSTRKPGWFTSKPPDQALTFAAEAQCVVPTYVDTVKDGKVGNFVIGQYPDINSKSAFRDPNSLTARRVRAHPDTYGAPHKFYKVTPENFFLKIFGEYTLGEFDLDPRFLDLEYPRYITVHPRLLRKLEMLKQLMAEEGEPVSKFKFIYAFRSPHYNSGARSEDGSKTLKTTYSTHMYGLAVDMIVDEDDDLVLDDLNGDGVIDVRDAHALLGYVNQLDRRLRDEGSDLVGGAGTYHHHDFYERGEFVQSPYVHMDARGFASEGGALIRWHADDLIGVTKRKAPYSQKRPIPDYPFQVQ